MNNDPRSHGLRERTAPPAPATVPLTGDAVADVAVVGAGHTGLSAALHLVRAGARVVAFSGYNGHGTAFGAVLADLVAGRIAKDDLPLPVTAALPIGFRAARELADGVGAQLVHAGGARRPGRVAS